VSILRYYGHDYMELEAANHTTSNDCQCAGMTPVQGAPHQVPGVLECWSLEYLLLQSAGVYRLALAVAG